MRMVGYLLPHGCLSCGLQGHLCSSTSLVSPHIATYEDPYIEKEISNWTESRSIEVKTLTELSKVRPSYTTWNLALFECWLIKNKLARKGHIPFPHPPPPPGCVAREWSLRNPIIEHPFCEIRRVHLLWLIQCAEPMSPLDWVDHSLALNRYCYHITHVHCTCSLFFIHVTVQMIKIFPNYGISKYVSNVTYLYAGWFHSLVCR